MTIRAPIGTALEFKSALKRCITFDSYETVKKEISVMSR